MVFPVNLTVDRTVRGKIQFMLFAQFVWVIGDIQFLQSFGLIAAENIPSFGKFNEHLGNHGIATLKTQILTDCIHVLRYGAFSGRQQRCKFKFTLRDQLIA